MTASNLHRECMVYKDQCVFCYSCPERKHGLFVCADHKYSFCHEHIAIHLKATSCKKMMQYVRHKRLLITEESQSVTKENNDKIDGQPVAKITKLAIGLEGGVTLDNKKYEIVEKWYLFTDYPNQSSKNTIEIQDLADMDKLDPRIRYILKAESAYRLRELEALAGTWDGSALIKTRHVALTQLPYSGPPLNDLKTWHCQHKGCDKTENLWLNLTDGTLLCGRRYADGSGGNNHAVEHYSKTGFPLAVNLGTVTPEGADVYSYDEDEMVIDTNLDQHLRHFGIDMLTMKKLEKTMLEKELDLNTTWEFASIQEDGKKLTPAYGAGFVGVHNLGNSCYINSLAQSLAQMPSVMQRVHEMLKIGFFEKISSKCGNPYEDFRIQLLKFFDAFTHAEYSVDPEEAEKTSEYALPENGIRPYDFRFVVGQGHREFSTKKQQDVEEFAHHLSNTCRLHFDPAHDPLVPINHIVHVKSLDGQTAYHKIQCVYDVYFPIENPDQCGPSEERKKFNLLRRMREIFDRPESSLLGCSSRFCTFPPYLLIKVNRHSHTVSNRPIKLNYALEVDDVLDLNFLRVSNDVTLENPAQIEISGDYRRDDSISACNSNQAVAHTATVPPVHNDLRGMGYSDVAIKKALEATKSTSLEILVNWLLEKGDDPNLNRECVEDSLGSCEAVDPKALSTLLEYGFEDIKCRAALSMTNSNIENAISLIFEPDFDKRVESLKVGHVEQSMEGDRLLNSPADVRKLVEELKKNDGQGVYSLCGIISHIGASTDTGHYVYHGKKDDGRWVIFNDEKVAWSESPPVENGYVYVFKRI